MCLFPRLDKEAERQREKVACPSPSWGLRSHIPAISLSLEAPTPAIVAPYHRATETSLWRRIQLGHAVHPRGAETGCEALIRTSHPNGSAEQERTALLFLLTVFIHWVY